MKTRPIITVLSTITFALLIFSCHPKKPAPAPIKDTTGPAVTITSPADKAVYADKAKVPFSVTMSDESNITYIHLHVTDATDDNKEFLHFEPKINAKSYHLDTFFYAQIATPSVSVEAIATDQYGNTTEKGITISVK